ncbi:MAG: hypothetical protein COB97_06655 [Paracoccus sp.]|nr:MAG: hypothetical protein COB97_06655 [Paracoccus sp. (in: a-proteobacteria)]
MRRKGLITAALCALALSGCADTATTGQSAGPTAQTPSVGASPELIAQAAEVAQLCQATMPDSQAFQTQLRAKGYRFEGIASGYRILSLDRRKLIAAASTGAARHTACGVTVGEMTTEQAIALAQPWIKATGAEQIPLENTRMRSGAAFDGVFKGTPVRIAIIPNTDLAGLRGTMLVAGEIE